MFYIVVAVILALVVIGGILGAVFAKSAMAGLTAIGAFIVLVVATGAFSFTTVSSRSVGVETSFGKYVGTLNNGPHFIAPWANVEEFSVAIQPEDKVSDVQVNFIGGGDGFVTATPRWHIDRTAAESLWGKYREFDKVRDTLVTPSVRDSFRVVMGNYLPNTARDGKNLRPITDAVLADLNKNLRDDGIVIDSISVNGIGLSDNTQKSIEKTVTKNQDIESAKADQIRAKIDAETARIREKTGALTPAALQRFCYDVTDNWNVQQNGPLPATWNCNAGGAQTPVIVGGK